MIFCGIAYLILPLLKYLEMQKKIPKWCSKKSWYQIMGMILVVNTMALLILFMDGQQSFVGKKGLARNSYGEGEKKEELIITEKNSDVELPITVILSEQEYTKEEIKKVFSECMEKLDALILKENEKLDMVNSDLYFPTKMPQQPITISWELDNYKVLDTEGKLKVENLVKEGTLVEVRGTLSYKDEEAQYIQTVKVWPPHLSKEETLLAIVKDAIAKEDINTKEKERFILPKNINGINIQWSRPTETRGYTILILGLSCPILYLALQKQNAKKRKKEKVKQMMIDYPEIVNKITLLMGAGMTTKNAWQKVVFDYQEQRSLKNRRYAYEEMCYTLHEMKSGMVEGESYERFGNRCGVRSYVKLGAMLSQNLRKGSKGLAEILSVEAVLAFEEQKSMAKKLGEEASTKLLMPLFLMLAIVLVIVVVPAFLSVQM